MSLVPTPFLIMTIEAKVNSFVIRSDTEEGLERIT